MITALWSRFSGWIIGALAVLAAVAGVYLKGRSAGKQVEQEKATERQLEQERAKSETIQEARDVETEISRLPADDVHQRLRDKWQRD